MNNANPRFRATTAVVLLLLPLSCNTEEEPYKPWHDPVIEQALETLKPVFEDLQLKPWIEPPKQFKQNKVVIKLHTREFWVLTPSRKMPDAAMQRRI